MLDTGRKDFQSCDLVINRIGSSRTHGERSGETMDTTSCVVDMICVGLTRWLLQCLPKFRHRWVSSFSKGSSFCSLVVFQFLWLKLEFWKLGVLLSCGKQWGEWSLLKFLKMFLTKNHHLIRSWVRWSWKCFLLANLTS